MVGRNTLDLVGDGDDTDLIEEIEASFGIELEDGETETLKTIGDLQDVLVRKLGASDRRREGCLTAAAFYRLRRAVSDVEGCQDIAPATPLDSHLVGSDYGKWREEVARRSGLRLPVGEAGPLVTVVFLLLFFGSPIAAAIFCFCFVYGPWGLLALAGWALLRPSCRLRPDLAPSEHPDLGSLARVVVCLNYRKLSDALGSRHPDDIFIALEGIVRHTIDFDGTIDRRTSFFA